MKTLRKVVIEKRFRDWSEGVFFLDGEAYGLNSLLETIYLGKEDDVRKLLEKGSLNSGGRNEIL